jgi:hypothetical protein
MRIIGIEQTNGGMQMMAPFAAHPGRWADMRTLRRHHHCKRSLHSHLRRRGHQIVSSRRAFVGRGW